jgi:hypothetical protein
VESHTFDSSIRYNSVARRPRDRLMIKAAELQGVLGRKLFSIELKPQIFIRFSRSRGKVGAGLCHWADQGGLLLGGIVQGKARAAAKLAGGRGQGWAQWNAVLVALSTADTKDGGA